MFEGQEILEKLIVGRVEPHIYAFSTNTIPNYLKIGDTYRPVAERLKEWSSYYPNLNKEFETSAKIENSFFRDFAIHKFLENDLQKVRLLKESEDFPGESTYYSKEFFKNTNGNKCTGENDRNKKPLMIYIKTILINLTNIPFIMLKH